MEYQVEKSRLTQSRFFDSHTQTDFGIVQMCNAHIHDWVEILYCTSGHMHVLLESSEFTFTKGDLLVIPSHEVHQITSLTEETHSYIVIKFQPELMTTSMTVQSEYRCIMPFLLHGNRSQRLFTAQDLEESGIPGIIQRFAEEYEQMDYGYEIALKAYFYHLILWILRKWHETDPAYETEFTDRQYAMMKQVYAFVESHYAAPITVTEMAEMCHVTYSYFSRLFSRMTGQTFSEYLQAVRLSASERLLITSEMSVTEIAYATGFSDLSYFTHRFTMKHGIAPRDYRKRYRASLKLQNHIVPDGPTMYGLRHA